VALTRAWGTAAGSRRSVQIVAELDRARAEIALLREELNHQRRAMEASASLTPTSLHTRPEDADPEAQGRTRLVCVPEDVEAVLEVIEKRHVTAKRPGDVWHVDLTVVPTGAGFWVPWLPFAMPQSWPFCWWVAVVVDHFSRAAVGFAIFFGRPTSVEVQQVLGKAIRHAGSPPRSIIADKGKQFGCRSFKRWCRGRAICFRFGAVGEHGSIAIVERFIRSMKNEGMTSTRFSCLAWR
jgi:transposase InsO family protein